MIEIIENNKNYVVCQKEPGIVSQYDDNNENMVTLLSEQLSCEIFPLHRLDRDVGGIMIFAKTKQQASLFSKLIQENGLHKKYYTIVEGIPETDEGEFTDLLYHDKQKNKTFVVKRERKGVKQAVLLYKTIGTINNLTLVDVTLKTGRTHQIRAQFSSRKMSLYGDGKYGSKYKNEKIALFSHEISFVDPNDKKYKVFSLEIPQTGVWKNFLGKT